MTASKGIYARRGTARAFYDEQVQRDTDECIEWPYHRGSHGYGVMTTAPKTQRLVHVIACEQFHGPKAPGQEVLHSCDVRACFNPRHLRWGTRQDNVTDMISRNRGRWQKNQGEANQ